MSYEDTPVILDGGVIRTILRDEAGNEIGYSLTFPSESNVASA